MLSRETLKKIGEAETEEECLLLCEVYDVSLEWFKMIWPAEQLGVDVLEHRAMITKVEHQFEPLDAYFDREAGGPRYRHTLAIQYQRYESGHLTPPPPLPSSRLALTPYVTISPVTTIYVDADQVPPSLQDAIDLF